MAIFFTVNGYYGPKTASWRGGGEGLEEYVVVMATTSPQGVVAVKFVTNARCI